MQVVASARAQALSPWNPQTLAALRTGSHAMPILPLTARTVATLRAPSDKPRIEYFDAEVPGLSLRITSDGVKTWTLLRGESSRSRAPPGLPAVGRDVQ